MPSLTFQRAVMNGKAPNKHGGGNVSGGHASKERIHNLIHTTYAHTHTTHTQATPNNWYT